MKERPRLYKWLLVFFRNSHRFKVIDEFCFQWEFPILEVIFLKFWAMAPTHYEAVG